MHGWTILAVFLVVVTATEATFLPLIAKIKMSGIEGEISLENIFNKIHVVKNSKDNLLGGYDVIDVHAFPAMFGRTLNPSEVCTSGVGHKLGRLFSEPLPEEHFSNEDYFHRSIVLQSSTNSSLPRVCATLLPSSEVTTHKAKFYGPIVGTVWLRHHPSVGAFVYGQLKFLNKMHGLQFRDINMFENGVFQPSEGSTECADLMRPTVIARHVAVYDHIGIEGTFAFIKRLANVGKFLAISRTGSLESCALLRRVERKTTKATMNWNGVFGYFQFTQHSPFEQTKMDVDLRGLMGRATGFYVHEFPVPQRLSENEDRCSVDLVGEMYSPYGESVERKEKDLSDNYKMTYASWDLSLWGPKSIVGRSIVIYGKGESRLLCGNIDYHSPVTTAITVFKSPAYGNMYFRQDANNPDEDTSVFVELANQDKTETQDHNWHVHVYPVDSDAYNETTRCSSAGLHYNPFDANIKDPLYKVKCRPQDPLLCELGDLSNRVGRINIASTYRTRRGKFFFTDEYLHLSGPFSVLGRSVVVHVSSAGAGRYVCANITQLHPVVAETGKWKGTVDGTVTGKLTFVQDSEFDVTKAYASLSGLDSMASGYHVHDLTISPSSTVGSECSQSSVSGHYIPFNWEIALSQPGDTYDRYEVGDLSGKYGTLDGFDHFNLGSKTEDNNLPLFTSLSSGDKSIVIHKAGSGARWKCSNLMTIPPEGVKGYVIKATVTFNTILKGAIKLRQVVYEDGGSATTSMEVDVKQTSGEASPQHNWHIHVEPVTIEDQCGVAEGHYDPYGAMDNKDYATDCKKSNPLFCEVGDLSAKQGRYDFGGGRKTFHDIDVPLHTSYTVLGRSIVFHVANGGAGRFACANIVPDDHVYTLSFPSTTNFNRYSFKKTVGDALGIASTRIVIIYNIHTPYVKDGCANVMIHIAGGDLIRPPSLHQLVDGSLHGLGEYSPGQKCRNMEGINKLGQKSDAEYTFNPTSYNELHWKTQEDSNELFEEVLYTLETGEDRRTKKFIPCSIYRFTNCNGWYYY